MEEGEGLGTRLGRGSTMSWMFRQFSNLWVWCVNITSSIQISDPDHTPYIPSIPVKSKDDLTQSKPAILKTLTNRFMCLKVEMRNNQLVKDVCL